MHIFVGKHNLTTLSKKKKKGNYVSKYLHLKREKRSNPMSNNNINLFKLSKYKHL